MPPPVTLCRSCWSQRLVAGSSCRSKLVYLVFIQKNLILQAFVREDCNIELLIADVRAWLTLRQLLNVPSLSMSGRQLCNAAQALHKKGKLNRLHILLGAHV